MKRRTTLVAGVAGMALVVPTTPASAEIDRGLCNYSTSRGELPADTAIKVCFDGGRLYFLNNLSLPMNITVGGDGVGTLERKAHAASVAGGSGLLSFIRPADKGLLPPNYDSGVSVGKGVVKVRITAADPAAQKAYVLGELVWRYTPGIPFKPLADLVNELSQVTDQHVDCMERNKTAWGDLGCRALLVRNVGFAYGRAGVAAVIDTSKRQGSIGAMVNLIDVTRWSDGAAGDVIKTIKGTREFTLAAAPEPTQPPAPPAQEPSPEPPRADPPKAEEPKQNPPTQPPTPVTIVVRNKHLEGYDGLVEDSTPSYLSSEMRTSCAVNGCKIDGTNMWSGDTFTAICQAQGPEVTNENRQVSDDNDNPHKTTTTVWYRGEKNGKTGFISAVYTEGGTVRAC